MKIDIHRTDGGLKFEGVNPQGHGVVLDGSDAHEGMRPMELLLTGMGACAAFDIVHILQRQRQPLTDIGVSVEGERPDEGIPKPFTDIRMHFVLRGDLDESKVLRAVKLSVEKYCSVGATLRPETKVSYTVQLAKT